jgi:hypothetical protein
LLSTVDEDTVADRQGSAWHFGTSSGLFGPRLAALTGYAKNNQDFIIKSNVDILPVT